MVVQKFGRADDLNGPIPRQTNGLDGEQMLPVVCHDESGAGLEGAGNDRVIVGVSGDEIDSVLPLHHFSDFGQRSEEALDLRIGQSAECTDLGFTQRLLDFGQQVR